MLLKKVRSLFNIYNKKVNQIIDIIDKINVINESCSYITENIDKLSTADTNLTNARRRIASFSTAQYIDQYMSNIPSVESISGVHDVALSSISNYCSEGLILEFGVFEGSTINYIAEKMHNTIIYGFDSFEGLPEFWRDGFPAGTFKTSHLPKVLSNVELIQGWFHITLPEFLSTIETNRKVSYLHIDCDLYSSTKIIFNHLCGRIVSGSIIVFDEYFNYPGWQFGEYKAFKEFLETSGLTYEYITYNRNHEQVAIRIL